MSLSPSSPLSVISAQPIRDNELCTLQYVIPGPLAHIGDCIGAEPSFSTQRHQLGHTLTWLEGKRNVQFV